MKNKFKTKQELIALVVERNLLTQDEANQKSKSELKELIDGSDDSADNDVNEANEAPKHDRAYPDGHSDNATGGNISGAGNSAPLPPTSGRTSDFTKDEKEDFSGQ